MFRRLLYLRPTARRISSKRNETADKLFISRLAPSNLSIIRPKARTYYYVSVNLPRNIRTSLNNNFKFTQLSRSIRTGITSGRFSLAEFRVCRRHILRRQNRKNTYGEWDYVTISVRLAARLPFVVPVPHISAPSRVNNHASYYFCPRVFSRFFIFEIIVAPEHTYLRFHAVPEAQKRVKCPAVPSAVSLVNPSRNYKFI